MTEILRHRPLGVSILRSSIGVPGGGFTHRTTAPARPYRSLFRPTRKQQRVLERETDYHGGVAALQVAVLPIDHRIQAVALDGLGSGGPISLGIENFDDDFTEDRLRFDVPLTVTQPKRLGANISGVAGRSDRLAEAPKERRFLAYGVTPWIAPAPFPSSEGAQVSERFA